MSWSLIVQLITDLLGTVADNGAKYLLIILLLVLVLYYLVFSDIHREEEQHYVSERVHRKGQFLLKHRRENNDLPLPNRDEPVNNTGRTSKKWPPELPGLNNNVANNSKSGKKPNGRKKTNFRLPPLASDSQDTRDSNEPSGGEVSSGKSVDNSNTPDNHYYLSAILPELSNSDHFKEIQGFPQGQNMGNFMNSEQDDSKGSQTNNFENSVTFGPDFLPEFTGKPEKDVSNKTSSLDQVSSASADCVINRPLSKQATSINGHGHSVTDHNNKTSHREVTKTIEKSKETQAKITKPTAAHLNASSGETKQSVDGSQTVKGTEVSRTTGTGARPKTHVPPVQGAKVAAPIDCHKMPGKNISKLIERAHEAAGRDDVKGAKKQVLQALVGIKEEQDRLSTGLGPVVSEQQLADWFGECSFIFNQIGEYVQSARYFYTATVYDPTWSTASHAQVSNTLWENIVYNVPPPVVQKRYEDIKLFLYELDRIARLAERRKRWHVCIMIDADIDRVHVNLRHFLMLGPENIREHPGRKEALWRTARCFLQIGEHMQVKKVCSIILQEFCDYNDVEALEIWSRALVISKDYDLALQKCVLALRYATDSADIARLNNLKEEIEPQIPATVQNENLDPDGEWLCGTNVTANGLAESSEDSNRPATPRAGQHGMKKKRRRPKAKNPALASQADVDEARKANIEAELTRSRRQRSSSECRPSQRKLSNGGKYGLSPQNTKSPVRDHSVDCLIYSRTPNGHLENGNGISPAVRRLQLDRYGARQRHESKSSTISDISYEVASVFDSDSEYSSDSASSNSSTYSTNNIEDALEEIEVPEEGEQTSFYEQSCRQYNDDTQDESEYADTDDKMLKHGVKLNMSYMHQFADKNPDVVNRDNFYERALTQDQMRERMLQNPKKYLKCTIQIQGSHEAFCTPIDSTHGISIIEISGRSKIGQVFNEDEVLVELLDDNEKHDKRYGKVLGVQGRQRHKDKDHPVFICTLDTMESHLVQPMCKTIPKIHIINTNVIDRFGHKMKKFKVEVYEYDEHAEELCNPKIYDVNTSGEKTYVFLVAMISWSPRHVYPLGAIVKIMNWGSSIPKGLAVLNLQHEVPSLYKKETVKCMECISREMNQRGGDELDSHMLQGRTDLTNLNTFTIDPPDSTDLDDALSVERIDEGYRVGVHIADVSAFVQLGDPIDVEAFERSTTFYPGIRKPRHMIPEPLSSNICSLHANKKRLTWTIFFLLDNQGRPIQMEGNNYTIVESFIISKEKLSYGQAQNFIVNNSEQSQLAQDVRTLFTLAKKIRLRRLGKAMFALNNDWEETVDEESQAKTMESHYLVEEFMIMANKKVAEVLCRRFDRCVPIRKQPPPSEEGLQEFVKKNGVYIDVMSTFQDRNIIDRTRGTDNALADNSVADKSVVVSQQLWIKMKKDPRFAVQCLQRDTLFALQNVIFQQWLSIQERAGYHCAASVTPEDGKHYSLNMYPYTHFTSPIRRYNDLVIHRLLRAYVRKLPNPYSNAQIDRICIRINSVNRRSKQYQRGCKALEEAVNLQENPEMMSCFIDDITDQGFTLCSPFLRNAKKANKALNYNLLDMGFRPEVKEDTKTTWDLVKATWRKRLYDFKGEPLQYPPDRGHTLELNPQKNVVFIPLHNWAKMLKSASEGMLEDLRRNISAASSKANIHAMGLDDVNTECRDLELLQPCTKFTMTFSRGQTLHVQMTAGPQKGLLVTKPMLYKMTNNINFCLLHADDPVLHLFHYVKTCTLNQYKSVKQYLQRWVPLILMEAAKGIIRNEESCVINNVPIKFTDRKGKFVLSLDHSDTRNIELSGTESDDEDDFQSEGSAQSYDWLCLKAPIPGTEKRSGEMRSVIDTLPNHWVGHAEVKSVKKKKDEGPSGKLTVHFDLHDKTESIPVQVKDDPKATKYSVEILKKSEVDRRTESFIKRLPTSRTSLATCIALNRPIPELDRDHAHQVELIERDLYFAASDNPQDKTLPRNNKKQQEAIDKALTSKFTLIQGPPGTGKTYTGIKLMYLFDKINNILHKEGKPKKQVLFCGPSNKSVDLVAKWMLQKMRKFKPNFVRVYGRSIEAIDFPIPGRTFLSKKSTRTLQADADLKSVALHHLIRIKGKPYAEEIKALDKYFAKKKYAPDPEKVPKYVHLIREASIAEIRNHDVILCTTAVGSNPKVLEATQVHQVIVDEAGMCPEPQCLVPIIATKAEQVVLIGDHKQLRPIIMCREAGELGLETSLFERYATTSSSKNVKFTMLNKQYRMHPQICEFPSDKFYEKKLRTGLGRWDDNPLRIWPEDQFDTYPHVLIHVEGEEKMLTVSTEDGNEQSRSNEKEIEEVIRLYRYLGDQSDYANVCIMSQYNAQCSEIRRRLIEEKFQEEAMNVLTVVSSQGGEWDYVIFSTVRSLPDYKIEKSPTLGWCKHNLGFITDRNQVNVALTRARKGLIIVGNKDLLACDVIWKKLVEHYDRRGCIKTPEEFPPKGTKKTRQEILLERQANVLRMYGDEMFVSGEGKATDYEGPFDLSDDDDDANDDFRTNRATESTWQQSGRRWRGGRGGNRT
ncbi:helicase with zinc finger domain 2-like isoform X1 [Mya arenaria]|uniref:helicase with zinc finger domain 2-like isoform X1 n=2 Tax=Mya arenaria TaxID=6604 RepID=UPI0022DF79C8|nr:helicase with zinc finger domain 2-like isoform X1 [Mya arenaria]